MPRAYRQLDLAERRTIFRLLNAKMPVAVIARELDRHRSTIHREIRRNHFHGQREYAGYYPLNAQDLAGERRRRQRKLCRNLALRDTIIAGLERCWSPEQIADLQLHRSLDCETNRLAQTIGSGTFSISACTLIILPSISIECGQGPEHREGSPDPRFYR